MDCMLSTADKDFGELIFRQHLTHSGVLLIRLAELSPSRKAELVSEAISQYLDESHLAFCVLTERTFRVRNQPNTHR